MNHTNTTSPALNTSHAAPNLRLAVRVDEACRALGIGKTSLYELISTKKLKAAVVAGRRVIPISELERLLAESIEAA